MDDNISSAITNICTLLTERIKLKVLSYFQTNHQGEIVDEVMLTTLTAIRSLRGSQNWSTLTSAQAEELISWLYDTKGIPLKEIFEHVLQEVFILNTVTTKEIGDRLATAISSSCTFIPDTYNLNQSESEVMSWNSKYDLIVKKEALASWFVFQPILICVYLIRFCDLTEVDMLNVPK